MPDLVLRLAKVSVNALRLGFGVRRPGLFARGLAAGFAAALRGRGDRRPVSREAWRLYERLGRRSARIEEIEAALPKERS